MAASGNNQEKIKENQEKLRQKLLEHDQGKTYGYIQKDPCKKVKYHNDYLYILLKFVLFQFYFLI